MRAGRMPGMPPMDVVYGLGTAIVIGLVLIFLAACIPPRRRAKPSKHPPGHCRSCGYDLTGNVSGVCPECGSQI